MVGDVGTCNDRRGDHERYIDNHLGHNRIDDRVDGHYLQRYDIERDLQPGFTGGRGHGVGARDADDEFDRNAYYHSLT